MPYPGYGCGNSSPLKPPAQRLSPYTWLYSPRGSSPNVFPASSPLDKGPTPFSSITDSPLLAAGAPPLADESSTCRGVVTSSSSKGSGYTCGASSSAATLRSCVLPLPSTYCDTFTWPTWAPPSAGIPTARGPAATPHVCNYNPSGTCVGG